MEAADIKLFDELNMKLVAITKELESSEEYRRLAGYSSGFNTAKEELTRLEQSAKQLMDTFASYRAQFATLQAEYEDIEHVVSESIDETELNYHSKNLKALLQKLDNLDSTMRSISAQINEMLKGFQESSKRYVGFRTKRQEANTAFEELRASRKDEINAIKAKIAELRPRLSPLFLEKYNGLRVMKKFPIIVAPDLANRMCTGCGMQFSPATEQEVKTKGMCECPNCGRILYPEQK